MALPGCHIQHENIIVLRSVHGQYEDVIITTLKSYIKSSPFQKNKIDKKGFPIRRRLELFPNM
jgi:hypothetical protein